jgi:hypothetical protein
MLHFFYDQRPEISDITSHAWYKGPTASLEDVRSEFNKRREIARQKANEVEGEADMEGYEGNRFYNFLESYQNAIKRGDEDELQEEVVLKKRRCEIFNPIASKKTKIFSKYNPKILLGAVMKFVACNETSNEINDEKFKVNYFLIRRLKLL